MQSHKSYAAYKSYKRMYDDMQLVEIDGQWKIQCSYNYREPVEEKFTPANSNREEALKATNAVIKRLIKSGRLEEFQKQMKEMEDMGTIAPLTEAETKNLELEPHHFNKLNFRIYPVESVAWLNF